ncbi:MAG: beta-ketoacyl-ACP synthase III [Deltaproteobacteria bacterium]|nr:beta-ketoacyl-ACP synthase III [Deltaproteobacteria bacterium]MBW2496585.1 beta-ketoacyl-ACP synthase III [Deltaproteobacteria bacterium]
MGRILITGTGLFTPPDSISNEELVESLARANEAWNARHAEAIARGEVAERDMPSTAFIRKASGIGHRYVMDKQGVLDPERLRPRLPLRGEDELSIQAEICVDAARQALDQAGRSGSDVDAVIVGCSNLQRAYPAIAIEVQAALGAGGFAYDMNVACSSATFAIQNAVDALRAGRARRVLVLSPEITSGHNNFELREFHFIFGDACTAVLLEAEEEAGSGESWEVVDTRLATRFSNNIRNDRGYLNRCEDGERDPHELVFRQNGRHVYREVCPMVAEHIRAHLEDLGLEIGEVRRLWLHQANLGMNKLIAKTLLGRDVEPDEAPVILDEYANTSSAGSVIAFHRHRDGLGVGDLAVLCSFGAGYSVGSVLLRKATD